MTEEIAGKRVVMWFANLFLKSLFYLKCFLQKIFFSDGANFLLNGSVNKQNCRIETEDRSMSHGCRLFLFTN